MIYHEDVINFQQSYVKFQQNIRDELHGKTAQFWMVSYIGIIRFLHQLHYSIQTNNYDLRLDGLKIFTLLLRSQQTKLCSIWIHLRKHPNQSRHYTSRM